MGKTVVGAGRHGDRDQVLGEALRLLQRRDELDQKIQEGADELDRGEGIDADVVFDRMKKKAADLMDHDDYGVMWCNLNAEADLLVNLTPGAEQISGSDKDERKEELFEAFRKGELKKLVTKPRIAAFGMNWQHCNHMTYFTDHSFEQYYQATRRLWRFGQTRPVRIDNILSESNVGVSRNLRRKAVACEQMFARMIVQMNDAMTIDRSSPHTLKMESPKWL